MPPPGATEWATLQDPCLIDVASYKVVPYPPPLLNVNYGAQSLAIATTVFDVSMDKFGGVHGSQVLTCTIAMWHHAIERFSGLAGVVDAVIIHANLGSRALASLGALANASRGLKLKLVEVPLPPVHKFPNAFAAGCLVRIYVTSLVEYDRVLVLDRRLLADGTPAEVRGALTALTDMGNHACG